MPKFDNAKSQASLEFLTTYGWAFLVILIMISTLAYFGILSPSKILPNRCNFGAEFQCLDFQITIGTTPATNTLKLKLKNNAGEAIDVTAITFSSESSTQYTCPTVDTNPSLPGNQGLPLNGWTSGSLKDLTFSGCNTAQAGLSSGEKGKVTIIIRYNTAASGSSYVKEIRGEVYSTVIDI